jgi:hypothetical protein
MSLDNPSILQECIRPFVVPQIDALSGIANNVPSPWICGGAIPDKLL